MTVPVPSVRITGSGPASASATLSCSASRGNTKKDRQSATANVQRTCEAGHDGTATGCTTSSISDKQRLCTFVEKNLTPFRLSIRPVACTHTRLPTLTCVLDKQRASCNQPNVRTHVCKCDKEDSKRKLTCSLPVPALNSLYLTPFGRSMKGASTFGRFGLLPFPLAGT